MLEKEYTQTFFQFNNDLFIFISSRIYLRPNEERQFFHWMRTNNKFYTGDEYHIRLGIVLSNVRYCQDFNKRNGLTFRVGINKFSCYTPYEYKSLLGTQTRSINKIFTKTTSTIKGTPDSFDWRDKGIVNPIKNQGDCGSC